MASSHSVAALAVPRISGGTGLETGAIRAIGVETTRTDYKGRPALRATALENAPSLDRLVILDTPPFSDGTIEAWVTGAPTATAITTAGASWA